MVLAQNTLISSWPMGIRNLTNIIFSSGKKLKLFAKLENTGHLLDA